MSEFTYETIADQLYHWGYDSTTPHKVRRRLKKVLRKQKLIPARPTLADYKKSRLKIRRLGGDELQ